MSGADLYRIWQAAAKVADVAYRVYGPSSDEYADARRTETDTYAVLRAAGGEPVQEKEAAA